MKAFEVSDSAELIISPRFPYKKVYLSEAVYSQLLQAQKLLCDENIKIIITRGYEQSSSIIKFSHLIARLLGSLLFCTMYPHRLNERIDIFSANGHDKKDKECVDISILKDDTRICLLPHGVFTSKRRIESIRKTHKDTLQIVWQTLDQVGFTIHKNYTEAMQIHCELRRPLQCGKLINGRH